MPTNSQIYAGPGNIVVVIPAYNEALTIGTVVLGAKKFAQKVIVVDDGSNDQTAEIANLAGAVVIKLDENRGKAYAVMRGFAEVKKEKYDAAVLIDADGQHDTNEIGRIVKPILDGEADLTIGSRFIENTHQIPRYRRVGQRVLNKFTNIGAKLKVTDTQSGFRAMSSRGIKNMDFRSDGYGLESSMIIHFASKGLTIKEVPINVNYKVPNKHKKNPVTMGFGLLNDTITLVSLKRPLMYLGVPGLIFGAFGFTLGLATVNEVYLWGWSWMFQSILAGFLSTIGFITAISGLTLNSISHIVGPESERSNVSETIMVHRDEGRLIQKKADREFDDWVR